MTTATRTVLEQYQVRKTKAQKTAFIEYVESVAAEHQWPCRVETGSFGVRNIVVGDVERAKVVYGAHYDTCAVLPFPNFITPKHFLIYLLYQIAIVLAFFAVLLGGITAVCAAVSAILTACGAALPPDGLDGLGMVLYDIGLILLLYLMIAGPANKHTANDNTSGVTVLLELMAELSPEERAQTALVFFDLEEAGLFGSAAFASAHKAHMKQTLLVNFDCVSDGAHMLFVVNKKARDAAPLLAECFPSTDAVQAEVHSRGVFYPSDQMNFPRGVGVAALKKSRRLGILYMDRIHTPKDTVYREANIPFLVQGAAELIRRL